MNIRYALKAIGLAAVLAVASSAVNATTYDFSYTFDTGDVITGSFTGSPTGPVGSGDVAVLGNISASLNAQPLVGSGSLYGYHYTAAGSDCGNCWSLGSAVASTNPLLNNFAFVDTPTLSGFSNYFYVIPWPNGNNPEATQYYSVGLGVVGVPSSYIDYYNGNFIPANWSLTAAVPEPSTWALTILGFAAVGFVASRRKNNFAPA